MKSDEPHMLPNAYLYRSRIKTRWHDNDVYGHVNNVVYYAFFDTVVNEFLISEGGLDIHNGQCIGLVVESMCKYYQPLAFPGDIHACMRVGKLGNSSVRYEIALFADGQSEPAAEGHFVHVYVDRTTRRPMALPLPMREALERVEGI